MSFTFKYVDDFCIASMFSPVPPKQGQVYIIDGKYLAAANYNYGCVSFIAKKGSWIDGLNKTSCEIMGPVGTGFSEPDAEKAIVIAGGTGIGAALSLLAHRGNDRESHLLFYQDRKSTRLNSSHMSESRMPSSA